jgi:hypothetical protein
VRYDTPEIAGFIASASWGADDVWDTVLEPFRFWRTLGTALGFLFDAFSQREVASTSLESALGCLIARASYRKRSVRQLAR